MTSHLLLQIATLLGANVVTLVVMQLVTFFLMNIKKPDDIARSVLRREASHDEILMFETGPRVRDATGPIRGLLMRAWKILSRIKRWALLRR
ncbi:hypothetical protein [Pararhizobium sp. PWRC1-1]|uniref:hypothetical protein n=1 Tax=Pararhizobium sp. PWRC1-1 TaxID=2804566 RepID=UPI003CF9B86A